MTAGKLQFCQNDWNLLKGKDRKDETEVEVQGTTRKLSRDADLCSLQRSSTAKAKSRHLWNFQDISFSIHSTRVNRYCKTKLFMGGEVRYNAVYRTRTEWTLRLSGLLINKVWKRIFDAEKVNLQAEQKVNRGFCTWIECAYCMCVYVIKTSMSHSGESTLTHNSANAERMSPKQHDSCCFLTPNLNHLSPLTQKMFWRMFMLKLNALFTENVVLCCSSQIFQIIKHTLLQYVAKKKKKNFTKKNNKTPGELISVVTIEWCRYYISL